MAEALATTPPTGVAKESIWKKLVSTTKQLEKIKDEATRVGENTMMFALEGGTAIGSGVLFAKFPQIAKIPGTEIDTQLVAGAGLALWGVIGKGKMSYAVGCVGRGLLIPWLYAKGLEIGEKL